jgi:hypothetical protein
MIEDALTQIAREVRQTYTLAYMSTNSARDGTYRQVRVVLGSPQHRALAVRTRTGYRAALATGGTYNDPRE